MSSDFPKFETKLEANVEANVEDGERRRRGRRLFRHSKIPVRMLVPNFFTLLSLCMGVTAIRMAIEQNFQVALLLLVLAAIVDGIDGRLARALKAQSRFGAELDSLADFVNFGVATALLVYIWGLGSLKGLGWIAVLVFACCLRLARFNSMLDVDKPKWQSNYFTGIPAPAGALAVLLPLFIDGLGLFNVREYPLAIALYTLGLAFMSVSTIPTFSGKLLGERISRDYVLPIFGAVVLFVGLLWTYPYATMSCVVLAYLAAIPFSYRRFQQKLRADKALLEQATPDISHQQPSTSSNIQFPATPTETKH
jgi:CDP-diacylglycerol---serine O-phosphatidyltransferase